MTFTRLAFVGLAAAIVAIPLAAGAVEDEDHDLARDLYERGEIHALSDILLLVGQQAPGDVVAVELVRVGEAWVYRVQVIAVDGRRRFVNVDAAAAAVIPDRDGER